LVWNPQMLHDPTPLSNLPFDQPWCNPKSGYNWNNRLSDCATMWTESSWAFPGSYTATTLSHQPALHPMQCGQAGTVRNVT